MAGPTTGRRWGRRAASGVAVLLLIGGGAVAMNWSAFRAGWAAKELRHAATDDARGAAAAKLVALGRPALPRVLDVFRTDDAAGCLALVAALRTAWQDTPPTDPAFADRCRPLLADAGTYSDAGKDAVLELALDALRCPDADVAGLGREVIRAGLRASATDAAVRATAAASLPEAGLRAEVVPLLSDPRPEVRRAALLAVGPATGNEPVIGAEELFRWLNDPDVGVRAVCESALMTRGLDGDQIAAARKLTHPDAAERLKLLIDLRGRREGLRDPGPWLERLSKDPDPAVRAGAARVASECQLTFTGWLDRLATEDPDGTVRDIAAYYRAKSAAVRQAGFEDR